MLAQLVSIRDKFTEVLATTTNSTGKQAPANQSKRVLELQEENKKLNYRINHLLRALDEGDSKWIAEPFLYGKELSDA